MLALPPLFIHLFYFQWHPSPSPQQLAAVLVLTSVFPRAAKKIRRDELVKGGGGRDGKREVGVGLGELSPLHLHGSLPRLNGIGDLKSILVFIHLRAKEPDLVDVMAS